LVRGDELTTEITIETAGVSLRGDLTVPDRAAGVVVFAHGSGSSRFSPRNQAVARRLRAAGFGTLLFDLLTADEEQIDRESAELRFDIALLSDRLSGAIDDLGNRESLAGLPVGCFGASTGAAAALIAASRAPEVVMSVVSRGGRPDLAGPALRRVETPTLLIVGARDTQVIELNRAAQHMIRGEAVVTIVPGAGHLFEEPGALGEVSRRATAWFQRTLRPRRAGG
jgi:pimeloyl-ACP methyl ester carboxylesterase